jgi:hypothetical protein
MYRLGIPTRRMLDGAKGSNGVESTYETFFGKLLFS